MTDIFKPIIDRTADFFHIFDTSYFITGVFGTLSILSVLCFNEGFFNTQWIKDVLSYNLLKEANALQIILLCILAYVNGVVFAVIGRVIRKDIYERYLHRLKYINRGPLRYFDFKASIDLLIFETVINYRLKDDFLSFIEKSEVPILKNQSEVSPIEISMEELFDNYSFKIDNFIKYYLHTENTYIYQQRIFYKYYIYIWSVMRDTKDYKATLTHLSRKWVTCTKYDGMCFILFLNSFLLLVSNFGFKSTNWQMIFCSVGLFLLGWWFIREARDTYKFMVQDLISTYSISLKKADSICRHP